MSADPYKIVVRPVVSEKAARLSEKENKYCFEVARFANKVQIRTAIEEIFKVRVTKVRTMTVPGKVKRLGRFSGRTPEWKKAIVTLREGQKIELF